MEGGQKARASVVYHSNGKPAVQCERGGRSGGRQPSPGRDEAVGFPRVPFFPAQIFHPQAGPPRRVLKQRFGGDNMRFELLDKMCVGFF